MVTNCDAEGSGAFEPDSNAFERIVGKTKESLLFSAIS
jgi:hypothetical protein